MQITDYKKVVFEYELIDTANTRDERTFYLERIYLDKNSFIERLLFDIRYPPFSHYQKINEYDTFKVINKQWYYKYMGEYKLFFSPEAFDKGLEIKHYINKPLISKYRTGAEYISLLPNGKIKNKQGKTIYIIDEFFVFGNDKREAQKWHFDPDLGVVMRTVDANSIVELRFILKNRIYFEEFDSSSIR